MIKDGIAGIEKDITSFLMIGQSNMAGRGDFGEVEPIDNSNCFMLRMGRWQKMSEPINPDRAIFNPQGHSGTNLCASFADRYAKHFRQKIGLIPCADGGTSISQWQPGEVLFDHAVMMTNLAKRTSNLGGILWHQGENDCLSMDAMRAYPRLFYRFFDTLLSDIGIPDLPIIVGELPRGVAEKFHLEGREKIFNDYLPTLIKRYPNMTLVSSESWSASSSRRSL